MTVRDIGPLSGKMSSRFAKELSRLRPNQKVRAIVMLRVRPSTDGSVRRTFSRPRRAAVKGVRRSTELAVRDIDKILQNFKGNRLSNQADALGSISVETTPGGIAALAASKHVRAILEDQHVFRI